MSNAWARIRRTSVAALWWAGWLAWPTTGMTQHEQHGDHAEQAAEAESAQHAEHAPEVTPASVSGAIAPVTDADRAAAFPAVGDARIHHTMLENPLNKLVLLDRFETQDASGGDVLRWDLDTWIGHDLRKLWIRTEGEQVSDATERAELELLWGKGFARWWDFLAGARRDFAPGDDQTWAGAGVRGIAPYRFELEATTYIADGGRAALRFETQYDILVTNRLVLQPLLELNWYAESDAARAVGSGLSDGELGLRLRYEFRREVAPYVGLVHERKFGSTADFARAAGDEPSDTRLVAGIRLWF